MSDENTRTALNKQAAARRRLQVLQAFVKGRRSTTSTSASSEDKKEMRWSPFVAFRRKVVGLQELNASSSDEDEETVGVASNVSDSQTISKKKRSEIFEEANYFLVGWDDCHEGGCDRNSIVSPTIRNLLLPTPSDAAKSEEYSGGRSSTDSYPLVSLLERREAAGTSIGDVQASARDGIDNTGNFHWPTEDITAAYFLNKMAASSNTVSSSSSKLSVLCELGAGCGLASFVIASALNTLATGDKHLLVVTDGNSRVVHTLKRNVKKLYSGSVGGVEAVSVAAAKLPWQCPTSLTSILCQVDTWLSTMSSRTLHGGNTDVTLFGSDCLFFERFHHELAQLVLKWLLHFQTLRNAGGNVQVLLFAPSRGGSLERFVEILKTEYQQIKSTTTDAPPSTINVAITADFDEHVSRVRREVAERETQFNPDRHLPMLVSIGLV